MSDKIEYSRLVQKRFTQAGVVPTIPASGTTTLSQMEVTDLLNGEFAINVADKKLWFRSNDEIVEIFGVSGGTYSNYFTEGDSNTSINSIPNDLSGGINQGLYNFSVGANNSVFSNNSALLGGVNNLITSGSDNSAIVGGSNSVISGASNVVMLGTTNVDAFQSDTVYLENLIITDNPSSGTTSDLLLVRSSDGSVKSLSVNDLPSGGAQNLLQVLQTGDYAEYGDTAYYLGQDGFSVDGAQSGLNYLIDHNASYTQITRSDDNDSTDSSNILLDPQGIKLESNSDIILGQFFVNNRITYDGQTMDVENVNDYIASANTNSFMPKSYIDSLTGGTSYTFTNGLTESGGTVTLGGTLTEPFTSIDANNTLLQIVDASTINLGNLTTFQTNTNVNNNILRLNETNFFVQMANQASIDLDSTNLTLDGLNFIDITSNFIVEQVAFGKAVVGSGFQFTSTNPDNAQKGMKYQDDYTLNWTSSTDDSYLATKGYVDRATSGSTPSGPVTSYYQFYTGLDNNDFYNDGNVKFSWNAPSNRFEMQMLTEPGGSADMRALAVRNDGTSQNTFVTQPNTTYSLFTAGVSAGSKLEITLGAEEDPSYSFYEIIVYNLGTSFNTSVKIVKIN